MNPSIPPLAAVGTAMIGRPAGEQAYTLAVPPEPHYHPPHEHHTLDPMGGALMLTVGYVVLRERFWFVR